MQYNGNSVNPLLYAPSALMVFCGWLLLQGCASTIELGPEDDMYALTAEQTMGVLKNIKDGKSAPNHQPITCNNGTDNEIAIFATDNGFITEEFWMKRDNDYLYLGIQNDYGRNLFRFENYGLFTMVQPSWFTVDVSEEDWMLFWLNEIGIQETGENKLVTRASFDVDDDMMEKIGTTRVKIFLDPIYSFLDAYYGVEEQLVLPPMVVTLDRDHDCNHPGTETTIVGK